MGQGNKKLSKRDPEASLLGYRTQGFLPEGLLNYLALLGWAIGPDRDVFTIDEMVAAFDIGDVNPNPARFDLKKAEAINADHMRMLSIDDLTHRVIPFLKEAGIVSDPVNDADARLLELAMPLVAERMNKLTEAVPMLGFLFVDEADFRRTDEIDDAGREVVRASYDALAALPRLVDRRRSRPPCARALVDGLGLKPRLRLRAGPGRGDRAAGSARRCSSPWSCSVASGRSPASRPHAGERGRRADRAALPPPPRGRTARLVAARARAAASCWSA